MKLKVKHLNVEAGGRRIVYLNERDANLLGVHSTDRVKITYSNRRIIAITNISREFPEGFIGLYREVSDLLKILEGEIVDVTISPKPESTEYIRAKIEGRSLKREEIKSIIVDVVDRSLSDIEIAAFITALKIHGVTFEEAEYLIEAMVETGKTLNIDRKPILDKHSIGGIPGDKTTLVLVPIIASLGYTIPKTSSRAITSPSGTADRMEVLSPVEFDVDDIRRIVEKTNGCIVWGGTLELAPADDIFIQVEYPLAIDPLLLPSILSKKKSVGATHLVIDIPTGRGAKMNTVEDAQELARDFIDLGANLDMNIQCAITFGEQPLGYCIGPALEAREALTTLMGRGPRDLLEKAVNLSGILLEMVGLKNGRRIALESVKSGKAVEKMREIIEMQGGDPKIMPQDIHVGPFKAKVASAKKGYIMWINNRDIAHIASEAGAPKEKGSGIMLTVKLGDKVKRNDPLFTIYAERESKLEDALKLTETLQPIGIAGNLSEKILLGKVPSPQKYKRTFILER
ncbi:MAG: AMP phosphorylase [Candidatus Methanomethylicota archaeon]|nr:MAG: AMP phosphorylase [Candidatus Verstraetearchaeota archaeon]